jgi:hypothetical protein
VDLTSCIRDDLIDFPSSVKDSNKLVFVGGEAAEFAEQNFIEALRKLSGRDSVHHIQVDVWSNLETCRFLELFPNAETLMLHGKLLRTTEGIGRAKALRKLFVVSVDGRRRNKVSLVELSESNLESLQLDGATTPDLEVIGLARNLTALKLTGGELPDFSLFKESKIRELEIVGGKIENLKGISTLSSLDDLWISYCTKLNSFLDMAPHIKKLTISACNKLDFKSIAELPALESLRVMSCKQLIMLDDLVHLKLLKEMFFTNCKTDFTSAPSFSSKKLEKIWLSPARDSFVRTMSQANPLVLICNGNATFAAGESRPVQDFYSDKH